MLPAVEPWDYLILTASNAVQAAAYESQLRTRRDLGLLQDAETVLVVPDTNGLRVGSGGSTLLCLMEVLDRELAAGNVTDTDAWKAALANLRILIVHAGGDSRRLPAYAPCGKAFVPVPGDNDTALQLTLFDRQLPTNLALPRPDGGGGQVVITAGDVLLSFDPAHVSFAARGVTGLGSSATPTEASRHGVYCADGGNVRLFLQKPSPDEQAQRGAIDQCGRPLLDVGVFNLDPAVAVALLRLFGAGRGPDGRLIWTGDMAEAILSRGLDFYRDVCCALGSEATAASYVAATRAAGSTWNETLLARIFLALNGTPFHVRALERCAFLHFGTSRQMITGGLHPLTTDQGRPVRETVVRVGNDIEDTANVTGTEAWVEGCRVAAELTLGGANLVAGVDIDEPLRLPAGACLDVIEGRDRHGKQAWFVRCYGIDDPFKASPRTQPVLFGRPLRERLTSLGAAPADVWPDDVPADHQSAWNARLFPAEAEAEGFRKWLWMFDVGAVTPEQRRAWISADRYSMAEMATLTNHDAFQRRRRQIRANNMRRSLCYLFRNESGLSAAELAHVLTDAESRTAWIADLLVEAQRHCIATDDGTGAGLFIFSRIIHTLGSALIELAGEATRLMDCAPGLNEALSAEQQAWLTSLRLGPRPNLRVGEWAGRCREVAFESLARRLACGSVPSPVHPASALRSDEIIRARAPARLDLGGGWTDTPPYSLEHGGCVINAAVNLNGRPPIEVHGHVIPEPVIRIASIDRGTRTEITELDELLDFRQATSDFALAKGALALSGFSRETATWPAGAALRDMLTLFGGGLELTTLAAIPKGSGLGTSSIMGAVVLAVVHRIMGRSLTMRELFDAVLRLEQALTTGGGWQDQIGGGVGGVKVITAGPGLVPDAQIEHVPPGLLDPQANGGITLLYYTGITRLAKNILQQVVGKYLDRDRDTMRTLEALRRLPPRIAEAMARNDAPALGRFIDTAWRLNKRLHPGSTNKEIEGLLARVEPHLYGAKLLGAGGGGFLLMLCKSPDDARALRHMLEADPPNDRARFFDFDISQEGLTVTAR